mgnify:CR=1 FL=1
MFNELSEEERKKYERIRDEFRVIKTEVDREIKSLEQRIQAQKGYLNRVKESRKIPGAERECEYCGIVSMKYAPRQSSQIEYECVICGEKKSVTPILDA